MNIVESMKRIKSELSVPKMKNENTCGLEYNKKMEKIKMEFIDFLINPYKLEQFQSITFANEVYENFELDKIHPIVTGDILYQMKMAVTSIINNLYSLEHRFLSLFLGYSSIKQILTKYCEIHKLKYETDVLLVFKGGNLFRHFFSKMTNEEMSRALVKNLSDYDFGIYTSDKVTDDHRMMMKNIIFTYLCIINNMFSNYIKNTLVEKIDKVFINDVKKNINEVLKNNVDSKYEVTIDKMKIFEMLIDFNTFEITKIGDIKRSSFKIKTKGTTTAKTISYQKMFFETDKIYTIYNEQNYLYATMNETFEKSSTQQIEFDLIRSKLTVISTFKILNKETYEISYYEKYTPAEFLDIVVLTKDDFANKHFLKSKNNYSFVDTNIDSLGEIAIYTPEYLAGDLFKIFYSEHCFITDDLKFKKRIERYLNLAIYIFEKYNIKNKLLSMKKFLDLLIGKKIDTTNIIFKKNKDHEFIAGKVFYYLDESILNINQVNTLGYNVVSDFISFMLKEYIFMNINEFKIHPDYTSIFEFYNFLHIHRKPKNYRAEERKEYFTDLLNSTNAKLNEYIKLLKIELYNTDDSVFVVGGSYQHKYRKYKEKYLQLKSIYN
jgi:hypothetical protein